MFRSAKLVKITDGMNKVCSRAGVDPDQIRSQLLEQLQVQLETTGGISLPIRLQQDTTVYARLKSVTSCLHRMLGEMDAILNGSMSPPCAEGVCEPTEVTELELHPV